MGPVTEGFTINFSVNRERDGQTDGQTLPSVLSPCFRMPGG